MRPHLASHHFPVEFAWLPWALLGHLRALTVKAAFSKSKMQPHLAFHHFRVDCARLPRALLGQLRQGGSDVGAFIIN